MYVAEDYEHYLINCSAEFKQIYSFGAHGDKGELVRF